jgi:hypothetical protein
VVRDNATGARISDTINFHTAANKPGGSALAAKQAKDAQAIQSMVRAAWPL